MPGYDEIILTVPDVPGLCHSLACARASRAAEVIVTYGTLNDPGASPYARGALWPESWGTSVAMCACCWDSSRRVAVKHRPGLVIIDEARAPAVPRACGGRA